MSKYERLSRLIQIVNTIRIHRRPDRNFLAEEFGVTVRTIQRDINSLCYAGVPIFWTGDGYKIMDGYYMPPTNLTLEEAVELVSVVRSHATEQAEPQRQAIESAISKIIARLSDRMLAKLNSTLDNADSEEECIPCPSSEGDEHVSSANLQLPSVMCKVVG